MLLLHRTGLFFQWCSRLDLGIYMDRIIHILAEAKLFFFIETVACYTNSTHDFACGKGSITASYKEKQVKGRLQEIWDKSWLEK